MAECIDCEHFGSLKPIRGGVFIDREGDTTRIMEACLPYCIKLNMGVNPTSYTNCNHFIKFVPVEEAEPPTGKEKKNA